MSFNLVYPITIGQLIHVLLMKSIEKYKQIFSSRQVGQMLYIRTFFFNVICKMQQSNRQRFCDVIYYHHKCKVETENNNFFFNRFQGDRVYFVVFVYRYLRETRTSLLPLRSFSTTLPAKFSGHNCAPTVVHMVYGVRMFVYHPLHSLSQHFNTIPFTIELLI